MYITFNETCVNSSILSHENIESSRELINNFVELLHKLKSNDLIEGIISTIEIRTFSATLNYSIHDWLSDNKVDDTHKKFFKLFLSKNCSYIHKDNYLSEFSIQIDSNSYNSTGCTVAAEIDTKVVSILTNKFWEQKKLTGKYSILDENGNLIVNEKSIINLSTEKDFELLDKIRTKSI